ncbi:hypothetical protein CHS0354_029601 [Potamilus streckersoni]|uniref:Uncharacterized protein n=1 Tax=Potamilus streckersoni TaxID=2493646 RepID=A0AAE0VIP8_9BIVA|nr:hypothetical protein CHS0354_029601 [Potamilus streckersoni]
MVCWEADGSTMVCWEADDSTMVWLEADDSTMIWWEADDSTMVWWEADDSTMVWWEADDSTMVWWEADDSTMVWWEADDSTTDEENKTLNLTEELETTMGWKMHVDNQAKAKYRRKTHMTETGDLGSGKPMETFFPMVDNLEIKQLVIYNEPDTVLHYG